MLVYFKVTFGKFNNFTLEKSLFQVKMKMDDFWLLKVGSVEGWINISGGDEKIFCGYPSPTQAVRKFFLYPSPIITGATLFVPKPYHICVWGVPKPY